MENNKSYLQRIHWVLLVSFIAATTHQLLIWTPRFVDFTSTLIIRLSALSVFFYLALGIVTRRWKAAAIACCLNIGLNLVNVLVIGDLEKTPLAFNLFMYALDPLPLLTFLILQFGWQKKLWTVYFIVFAVLNMFYAGFYSWYGISTTLNDLFTVTDTGKAIIGLISGTAALTCIIIFVCEISNYMSGKASITKTKLLNLGNDYRKVQGLVVFWSLKTMCWLFVLHAWQYLASNIAFIEASRGDDNYYSADTYTYYNVTGLINLVASISATILLAWYLRKFLLEFFVTYGIRSKFIYWFSLLPIIGFLSFFVVQWEAVRQTKFRDKLATLGQFAASSTTSITGIFLSLIALRLIMRIAEGEPMIFIPLIINLLLFIWLMADKTGFYVTLTLNLLLSALGIIATYCSWLTDIKAALLFAMVILNMMHLVLLYPVYHFDHFEYTPAEDPDASEAKEFHLFDTHQ